jgi:glycosyltransferase involved in cell wall biosynthesis
LKALFVHSHIFKFDSNGNFYSNGQFPYKILNDRYLNHFDELIIAARGEKNNNNSELNLSSGKNIRHYILPNISKISGRYQGLVKIRAELKELILDTDVLIARMPSIYAYEAIKIAKGLKKPYVVEVVGDVFLALWTHGSLFGKILAPINFVKYRKIIKDSNNLIYVTKNYLQEIYPHKSNANTISASNVEIPLVTEDVLLTRINKIKISQDKQEIRVGVIGSYSSKYKGIDTAIRAINLLSERGYNCKLFVLGNGNNKWLIDLSKRYNVENNIIFSGSLPGGEKVFEWLDSLDLYIQPSLTEGLPRALIEAMSRGLPCVASSVGGIPELIDEKFIHKPKSEYELAVKLEHLIRDSETMISQAEKNYYHAKNYTCDVLNKRRSNFWENLLKKEFC